MSLRAAASALRSAFRHSFPKFRLRHPLWLVPACLLLLSGCALVPYAQGIAGLFIAVATLLGLAACDSGGGSGTTPITWPNVIRVDQLTSATGFILQGQTAQSEQLGYSVAGGGDLNGDGRDDIVVGAPNANASAGRAYVVFGRDNAGSTFNQGGPFDITGLTGSQGIAINGFGEAGTSLAIAADVNGDGGADLLIGEPNHLGGRGRAWVLFGGNNLNSNVTLNIGGGASIASGGSEGFAARISQTYGGNSAYTRIGESVAALDVNGDGLMDPVFGGPNSDAAGGCAPYYIHPRAAVVFGESGLQISGADLNIGGSMPNSRGSHFATTANLGPVADSYGTTLAASAAGGDLNGDGQDDLILSVDSGLGNQSNREGAVVVFGKTGANPVLDGSLASADFKLIAPSAGTSGLRVAYLGDVNGDGFGDFALVLPSDYQVAVVFGSSGLGGSRNVSGLNGSTGFRIDTLANSQQPTAVAGADVNNDGINDILVGVGEGEGGSRFLGHVIFGKSGLGSSGTIDLTSPLTDPDGFSVRLGASYYFGDISIATGDVNGDGHPDLIVGAYSDPVAGSDGRAYVIFNPGPQ